MGVGAVGGPDVEDEGVGASEGEDGVEGEEGDESESEASVDDEDLPEWARRSSFVDDPYGKCIPPLPPLIPYSHSH